VAQRADLQVPLRALVSSYSLTLATARLQTHSAPKSRLVAASLSNRPSMLQRAPRFSATAGLRIRSRFFRECRAKELLPPELPK
jgi:hypothetical protein